LQHLHLAIVQPQEERRAAPGDTQILVVGLAPLPSLTHEARS